MYYGPNNFAPASKPTQARGPFVNGGLDGPLAMLNVLGVIGWTALFAAHAARQPRPRSFVSGGSDIPRLGDSFGFGAEYVVNRRQPDQRLVDALKRLREMPLPAPPKPAAQNWAPSRWFVEPRPFGDGYDVCTYVALGRLYPMTSHPLKLVLVALDSPIGETPFRTAERALNHAARLNKWPRWFPEKGAWRLTTETTLVGGREVAQRQQRRPLSELLAALKETASVAWLYLRWLGRKIVSYLTK